MALNVLVVDDSALVRALMTQIINAEPDMNVIGTAPDPYVAREKIKLLNPDVITLDVEMPKMDGLVFLEKLMRLRPMPVVMVSSLTERSSELTLKALELGAIDFVTKPKMDIRNGLLLNHQEIIDKIRTAAIANVSKTGKKSQQRLIVEQKNNADVVLPFQATQIKTTEKLIIIGASTGGTEAIKELLTCLPADAPGTLITQHMPAAFTKAFAERLNKQCKIVVKEAADGDRVLPGHAYVAPGDRHLLLARNGANYITRLTDAPPVSRHRPSVDVLFRSAANAAGSNAIGVILTGMGDDGAIGMLEMKQAGAFTIAQDERSCVVFGMPKEAIARGGVDEIIALENIAQRVLGAIAGKHDRAFRV